MSILIKGMEMPKMCADCLIRDVEEDSWGDTISETCPIIGEQVEEYGWTGKKKRHEDCPLVEIPTPHGRIIDADRLIDDLNHDVAIDRDALDIASDKERQELQEDIDCKQNAAEWLDNDAANRTVIEAEDKDV